MHLTIAQKVAARIRQLAPQTTCDDCLARDLKFANRQQANRVTNALSLGGGFRRELGTCDQCKGEKLVITTA